MNKIDLIIIDKEDVSKTLIENYLKNVDFVNEIKSYSSIEETAFLLETTIPSVVVIDISANSKETLDFVKKVSESNPLCKIILISYNLSTNFIVDALRSGAKDFLAKPLIREEIVGIIKKINETFSDNKNSVGKSTVISAFSNKGGLGKTTVAVNLAKELAEITKEKVVLVDLNMHLGDVTAFLDINPNYDIKYIIDNLQNASEDFLLGTLEQYKGTNLYVLADSPYREPSEEISGKQLKNLLNELKKTFSYIILDCSSSIDSKTTSVFDESDLILFITTANLPTLRNCQRCLDLFDKMGYSDDRLKLVLNRYINNEDYTVEDVETTLNKNIFWKIPNNYFAVIGSINKGLTLQELNPTSNVTQNFRELAQEIINRE